MVVLASTKTFWGLEATQYPQCYLYREYTVSLVWKSRSKTSFSIKLMLRPLAR